MGVNPGLQKQWNSVLKNEVNIETRRVPDFYPW